MKELKALINTMKQFNYIMNQKQKREAIFIFFLLILSSLLELISISIILPFIYAIMDMDLIMKSKYVIVLKSHFSFVSETFVLFGIVFLISMIYLLKNLVLVFIQYQISRFGCNYKKEVSTHMLSAYLHQPYIAFSNLNMADVLQGIYSDVEASCSMLSTLLKMLADLLGLVAVCIFLFYKDKIIAGGLIALATISGLVLYKGIRSKMKVMGFRQRDISAKTYKIACEAIGGIKDIMVMNRQSKFEEAYEKKFEEKRKIEVIYNCFLGLPNRLIETVFISGLLLIVSIRYSMGIENTTFIANLAIFVAAAIKIMPYISRIISSVTQLIYTRRNTASVYEHLQKTSQYIKNNPQYISKKDAFKDSITADDLVWRYPGDSKNILQGVNFSIKKGEAVAFIGESGAGKTTLADIILGLYTPQKGTIKVDGVNIFDIPEDWAKLIGYVPQTVYLLDDTIRNNILFGEQCENDEKIWKALEEAQIKEFVMSLPEKLDTVVGERGIKFSGGQCQRIAIARALYYDPDILVLDEATSALDNETEGELMASIEALHGMKTLIIIAHRLSTIRNCDKIYEIKNGIVTLRDKADVLT